MKVLYSIYIYKNKVNVPKEGHLEEIGTSGNRQTLKMIRDGTLSYDENEKNGPHNQCRSTEIQQQHAIVQLIQMKDGVLS